MSDIERIILLLKDASPWLVLSGAILFGWVYFLRHRRLMKQSGTEQRVETRLEEQGTVLSRFVARYDEDRKREQKVGEQEVGLLQKLHDEFVHISAVLSGSLSPENAKHAIRNQWNWCRASIVRTIRQSIISNNIRDDEDRIAYRVYKAWKHAADESKESLDKYKGLDYPYENLYICLSSIWIEIWDLAVPLYYRKLGVFKTLDEALDDLSTSVTSLFDSALETHFDIWEDVNSGLIYRDDSVKHRLRKHLESLEAQKDLESSEVIKRMAIRLKEEASNTSTTSRRYKSEQTRKVCDSMKENMSEAMRALEIRDTDSSDSTPSPFLRSDDPPSDPYVPDDAPDEY